MLTIQRAKESRRRAGKPRIGLALAGGGPLGGIYEIGSLLAMRESMQGIDFTRMDAYVGVSSGGLVASGLANQMTVAKMCRIFIRNESLEHLFAPEEIFFKPAFREYLSRVMTLPEIFLSHMLRLLTHPLNFRFTDSITDLTQAIPTGVFNNDSISEFFNLMYTKSGRTDDFRELRSPLLLVAVDLDTAEPVVFGRRPFDHVPISKAVQASAALPGLYSPVEIDGRSYVDGALRKTMHASAALEEDLDLLLCINPIVPFDASLAARTGAPKHSRLVRGGLPVVLSQTFRTLIYSRMAVGMKPYATQYPQTDILLFMPNRDDPKMFFTNVFSYANRRRVCEHAYQTTRQDLLARKDELIPILKRAGITLRVDLLEDKSCHYWTADKRTEMAVV